jgi:hypothetical protein
VLLADLADVVARADPFSWTDQLRGDQLVIEPRTVIDAGGAQAVEPVVAVNEDNRAIGHEFQKQL